MIDEAKKKRLDIYAEALKFHAAAPAGKIQITHKPINSIEDLSKAYSPGVAAPCLEIQKDPNNAYLYTGKANSLIVASNGTAVLGLGDIGADAAQPVMEGKAALFNSFGKINAINMEVRTKDPKKFIETIALIAESWGGVNLEDIKAPECFEIEKALKEKLSIPVFHDDQHGTAIVILAALLNACEITKRDPKKLRIVVSGAGAAALSTVNLITSYGIPKENIVLCDLTGILYKGRENVADYKIPYLADTKARTLQEALKGADMFIGLSAKDALPQEYLKDMAPSPLIFALANPDPEIRPELVYEARPDAIVATGRSDYANQINNLLCFPYIFRGALDTRSKAINIEMKLAAANAIAQLAKEEISEQVRNIFHNSTIQRKSLEYGKEYIVPSTFDRRLFNRVSKAVAQAAIDSGVARIIPDLSKIYG